ncbi:MAG: hypothetical protein M0Z75_02260 [Nitrospiraceae bacterium]|nr:hypothetical protein [Nitrospiraceae bacterium]
MVIFFRDMEQQEEREELEMLRQDVKRLRRRLALCTPSLAALLRRKGLDIFREGPAGDLLIPEEGSVDEWYEHMKRYSFRLYLRDVIKQQERFTVGSLTRYATADVTAGYTQYLLEAGVIEEADGAYRLKGRRIRSFGETLEWFAAQILSREFQAEAIWGVKLKRRRRSGRPRTGGDYDVVAKIDGGILYMEVKSSPPKQIYPNEITAFLERTGELAPEIAVFFMDTELRMKDKIVPMFEEALPGFFPAAGAPAPVRLHRELFRIGDKMFIINAKGSVAMNIERVLCHYFSAPSRSAWP